MNPTRATIRPRNFRVLLATIAVAALALLMPAAPPVGAAGLRNCVDVPVAQSERVGCWEYVWANDVQVRMTFSNTSFKGAKPGELDPFYVIAPQGAPQGAPPNTFPHDHVVRDVPAQNHGNYSVQLQGFFVLCRESSLASEACVASPTSLGGPFPFPFAKTVNGQPLTSAGAIESAAAAGLVTLVNLGPGAVIVGRISGHK